MPWEDFLQTKFATKIFQVTRYIFYRDKKAMLSTISSKTNYLHVGSLAKYLDIHGGKTVDLKRDDLMISPGFPGIKHNIYLHGLVWYQDSR